MTAQEIVEPLLNTGFSLWVDGSNLRFKPKPDEATIQRLRKHKAEIISYLSANPGIGTPPSRGQKLRDETHGGEGQPLEAHLAADWVMGQLPVGDADRRELESLIEAEGQEEDNLLRLKIRLVEVYGRRINPNYRAAIWGDRTWDEVERG